MNLDSHKTYATLDTSDIRFGIEHLPEQVRVSWEDTRDFVPPAPYSRVSNVLVIGMGGSALGPRLLVATMGDRLKVPVTIVNDYHIPGWVGSKTLVVLSSFSGATEEVLAAGEQAQASGARIMVIAAEGELVKRARVMHWPMYQFNPGDLAKQPRLGVGFSLAGVMGLLERNRLLKVARAEIDRMCIAMGEVIDGCAVDVPSAENPAKIVAKELVGKSVFVVGAQHLVGSAHTFANQINETSKQFAVSFAIPELNHHLLEGLTYPRGLAAKTVVILLKSDLYDARIKKRFDVTADMLERQGLWVVEYETCGDEHLEQVGEVLQFGSFVSYYLAMLNGVRPDSIPFVDEFKARLGKK